MIASLKKESNGYTARFERMLNHSREEVWAMLTDNNQLKKWFPELQAEELKNGGKFKFDMGDGSYEEMKIIGFEEHAILEYTWGKDIVRFELNEIKGGTELNLIEKISEITDHTPRDLAGWHVCLDVICRLLEGKSLDSRSEEWETWYDEYKIATETIQTK
ncbi:activator of Hsp90 ATPase 1 family protein [Sporosarcina globispora]|uniref:Activator of Hsp90 ATPase 1 family protein n=1 Tax=Sporosarcina globispora TaxID=1459 RepID=A0A0M0GFP8_SPOGL|nr:SRPBCC family protein [Sporosarcina globispora]KON88261.1 activator of Hsp90 ATPase 1 family protein [Sporosarcina globispora]